MLCLGCLGLRSSPPWWGDVAGEVEESWVHKPSDLLLCSLWPLVLLCYSQEAIDMPLLLIPGSAQAVGGGSKSLRCRRCFCSYCPPLGCSVGPATQFLFFCCISWDCKLSHSGQESASVGTTPVLPLRVPVRPPSDVLTCGCLRHSGVLSRAFFVG